MGQYYHVGKQHAQAKDAASNSIKILLNLLDFQKKRPCFLFGCCTSVLYANMKNLYSTDGWSIKLAFWKVIVSQNKSSNLIVLLEMSKLSEVLGFQDKASRSSSYSFRSNVIIHF